jgi:hypothetical protein
MAWGEDAAERHEMAQLTEVYVPCKGQRYDVPKTNRPKLSDEQADELLERVRGLFGKRP